MGLMNKNKLILLIIWLKVNYLLSQCLNNKNQSIFIKDY